MKKIDPVIVIDRSARTTSRRVICNRSRDEYDEATAYDSYMNPGPGFRAGPGNSYDAA